MAMTQKEKTDYKRKYNEEKYKRVNMYLFPDVKEQWEVAAKKRNMNLSEFIKMCVSDFLEREKPDCGIEFYGGPRARRCPDCAYKAQQETNKAFKKRGAARPLGSVDKCEICGKEYVVTSGRQKYCSKTCQHKGVLAWHKEHKKGYNRASGQYAKMQERRKQQKKICVYCLQTFASNKPTNVCSDHCRKEQRRLQEYAAELNRGRKADYDKLLDLRNRYREAVKTSDDLSGFSGSTCIDYSKYSGTDMSGLTRGEQSVLLQKIKNPDASTEQIASICGLSIKSIPTLLSRATHKLDSKQD